MTKTTDHYARGELLARQFNTLLKAQGLGVKARKDRKSLAREAKAETVERRHLIELRRQPSYTTAEARQLFQPETRLISAAGRSSTVKVEAEVSEPPVRPTYEQMRVQKDEYPDMPAEVREHQRRRREQRRARNRAGGGKNK